MGVEEGIEDGSGMIQRHATTRMRSRDAMAIITSVSSGPRLRGDGRLLPNEKCREYSENGCGEKAQNQQSPRADPSRQDQGREHPGDQPER